MTVPGLAITDDGKVRTIRFDRPGAFNAFTGEMVSETSRPASTASPPA